MIYAPGPSKARRVKPWSSFKGQPKKNSKIFKIVAVLFLVLGVYHVVERCQANRGALRSKYLPTRYPRLTDIHRKLFEDASWQWVSQPISRDDGQPRTSYTREALLASRTEWNKLGKGFEGETFNYGDYVVKVFDGNHSPFRNCVPGWDPELRWPTEISASLVVNGLKLDHAVDDQANIVPITDYFLSPKTETDVRKWHMVTPLFRLGHLGKLAQRLKESSTTYAPQDLDLIFRPSLHGLLDALDELHSQHDLCHDDVKLDNIFLASPSNDATPAANETRQWLLADMGNVRETQHAFHASSIWTADNFADCQANDVVRLVKTYMQFLRGSMRHSSHFDRPFIQGQEAWARLFWSVLDGANRGDWVTALSTKERSLSTDQPNSELSTGVRDLRSHNSWHQLFVGRALAESFSVQKTLKIKASETGARRWGLVPFLGMPRTVC
ncbi:hypothetical protein N3K66_007872 [Trichothecium roseum]|uniref:Uncharacterized protein n=1 Tax=Trichothecium roseum TaxID=47278 RepID=A0ACC0UT06_9HYPO|nr:hypothetical protein N3K66_007872 [Trichothecium roseum]